MLTGWWFGTFGLCSHILGIIIPTDELIFLRRVQPTNQLRSTMIDEQIEASIVAEHHGTIGAEAHWRLLARTNENMLAKYVS